MPTYTAPPTFVREINALTAIITAEQILNGQYDA